MYLYISNYSEKGCKHQFWFQPAVSREFAFEKKVDFSLWSHLYSLAYFLATCCFHRNNLSIIPLNFCMDANFSRFFSKVVNKVQTKNEPLLEIEVFLYVLNRDYLSD